MNSKIVLIAVAVVCAGASGCSNKAAAQTPPAPTRMLTADTDINQLASGTLADAGSIPSPPWLFGKVVDGPFVFTDAAMIGGTYSRFYTVASGQDCTLPDPSGTLGPNARYVASISSPAPDVHGMRVLVKMGDTLCASWTPSNNGPSLITWSGWKPY